MWGTPVKHAQSASPTAYTPSACRNPTTPSGAGLRKPRIRVECGGLIRNGLRSNLPGAGLGTRRVAIRGGLCGHRLVSALMLLAGAVSAEPPPLAAGTPSPAGSSKPLPVEADPVAVEPNPVPAPSRLLALTWQAPEECAGPERFQSQVETLDGRFHWDAERADTQVRVTLIPAEGRALLALTGSGDTHLEREVAGPADCESLSLALAFALVVALDPSNGQARTPVTFDATPPPASPAAPVEPAPTPAALPPASKPARPKPARPRAQPPPARDATEPPATLWASTWMVGVGAGLALSAPGGEGPGVAGLIGFDATPIDATLLHPRVELGVGYRSFEREQSTERGRVRAVGTLWSAGVGISPIAWNLGSVQLWPRASLDLGQLGVQPRGVAESLPRRTYWATPGLDWVVSWTGESLGVRLAVGGEWRLNHPHFRVQSAPEEAQTVDVLSIGSLAGRAWLTLFLPFARSVSAGTDIR